MLDEYTIMEYEYKTKSYTLLGYSVGSSSDEAKSNFIVNNSYNPKEGTMLFAKPPLCR